jgi:hypothetical protein
MSKRQRIVVISLLDIVAQLIDYVPSMLLALNRDCLQMLKAANKPMLMDWSAVRLGNIDFCTSLGLQPFMLGRVAMRNGDAALLRHVHANGLPLGDLMETVNRDSYALLRLTKEWHWKPSRKSLARAILQSRLPPQWLSEQPVDQRYSFVVLLTNLIFEDIEIRSYFKSMTQFSAMFLFLNTCRALREYKAALTQGQETWDIEHPLVAALLLMLFGFTLSNERLLNAMRIQPSHFYQGQNWRHEFLLDLGCLTGLIPSTVVWQSADRSALAGYALQIAPDNDRLRLVAQQQILEVTKRRIGDVGAATLRWLLDRNLIRWSQDQLEHAVSNDNSQTLQAAVDLGLNLDYPEAGWINHGTPKVLACVMQNRPKLDHLFEYLSVKSACLLDRPDWLRIMIENGSTVLEEALLIVIECKRYHLLELLGDREPGFLGDGTSFVLERLPVEGFRQAVRFECLIEVIYQWLDVTENSVLRKSPGIGKALLDAELLEEALPIAWIGDSIERFNYCTQKGLSLSMHDVHFMLRKGSLELLQHVYTEHIAKRRWLASFKGKLCPAVKPWFENNC